MKPKFTFKMTMLVIATLLGSAAGSYGQSCTANAGGNATVCGSSTTLTGGASGVLGAGSPSWTFISGPATPVIASPGSFNTAVTGMVTDGDYVFQLSQPCSLGIAESQVTIKAHPRPATFTAGPDKTNICATVGMATLDGVIPTGFTGSWSAVNIYNAQRFNTVVTTNSSFSNNTIGNPVFSLIHKADHEIDPAYYAILTIVSNDGVCTYSDTAVVRFCPNPALEVINISKCIDVNDPSSQFMDFTTGPGFSSNTPGAAGAAANGTTITINAISQPAGGNITFDRITDRRIYVTGAAVLGTYNFTITVSNCCGTVTSSPKAFTVTGQLTQLVNLQPTGHGAPEQLALYASGGSGGELHCGIAGTSTPETFYFSIAPSDNPATTTTTVTSAGILPPGASAPIITQTGTGMVNRMINVNPGTSGWKVGTYEFRINVGTSPCFRSQTYYIHVSDNNRLPLFVPDTTACYPGTGSVSAVITLPEIYQGGVNPSYFQDFGGYYNFQVLSKPAGSATPLFPASNLRRITQSATTISNLDKPGDYTIRLTPFSGNGAGPFLEQEYACSGIPGPLYYDFTIHLEEKINSNAGSDQTGVCSNTVSLLGNAAGSGNGEWTVISTPAGSSPNIVTSSNPSTTATGLTEIGEYLFAWTITTPLGGCQTTDTVSFEVICEIPLSTGLSDFAATKESGAALLEWTTLYESNNKGFEIERSANGNNWIRLGFVNSKAANGNSNIKLDYSYTDKRPLNGLNFYRLRQTDFDGKYEYSPVRQVSFDNNTAIIYPNPANEYIEIGGLNGDEVISIYDATGRLARKVKASQTSVIISMKALGEGIYNVHIADVNSMIVFKKIVKIK